MNGLRKLLFSLVMTSSALLLGACEKQGPAESAGAKIDEAADNIKEGESPLADKGPLEEAGETVDETLDGDDN